MNYDLIVSALIVFAVSASIFALPVYYAFDTYEHGLKRKARLSRIACATRPVIGKPIMRDLPASNKLGIN